MRRRVVWYKNTMFSENKPEYVGDEFLRHVGTYPPKYWRQGRECRHTVSYYPGHGRYNVF
jgi:hypothetical protein